MNSPPALLLVAPLIMWCPSFFGQTVYLDDLLIFSMPLKMEWAEQIRHGLFPLWSEKIGAGYPVFAESQIGALFPLNVLFLPPWPARVGYAIFAILCVWVAGLGYYAVARRFIPSRTFQLLSALLYASSGFTFFHWAHLNILGILALLPWLVHFFGLWADTGRWRYLAACGGCGALIVISGYPQFVVIAFLTLGLFSLLFDRISWSRRILGLAAVAALTAGLSAIQWLPTLELSRITTRGLMPSAWIEGTSLKLKNTVLFLFPGALLTKAYTGQAAIEFSITSVGSFLALLSLLYIKTNRTLLRLWGIVLVAFVLGTIGGYSIVVTHIPLMRYVRDIHRFALPAYFCLPLLAALAVECSGARAGKWRLAEGLALLALLALPPVVRNLPGVWAQFAIFLALVGLWANPMPGRRRGLALVAISEIFLWAVLFGVRAYGPADRAPSPLPLRPPIGRVAVSLSYHHNPFQHIFRNMVAQPVPAFSWLYVPQAPILWGVSSAQCTLQLEPPWFPGLGSYQWNHWVLDPDRPLLPYLRMAGVSHLVSATGRFSLPEEGSLQVFSDLRAHLYRVSNEVQYVRFYPPEATEMVPGPEEKLVGRVLAPRAPLMNVLYLVSADAPTGAASDSGPAAPAAKAEATGRRRDFQLKQFTYRGTRIGITGTTPEAGFLFVSATYAPGWSARVNQRPAPLYRAQYQFMAVPVPAGHVEVLFRYDSPGFRPGGIISLISLCLLGASLFLFRR